MAQMVAVSYRYLALCFTIVIVARDTGNMASRLPGQGERIPTSDLPVQAGRDSKLRHTLMPPRPTLIQIYASISLT